MTPIITVGRICAQKDPAWFLDAHQAYGGDRPWVWVGGASDDDEAGQEWQRQLLAREGIAVTGWIDRPELAAWYKRAHVYVHTAAWEGFPMAILEAATYSLPIVARKISAVEAEGIEYLCLSPEHMARWVEQLDDEYQWRRSVVWTCTWLAKYQERQQRAALLTAYGIDTDTR